ncbi:MAG: S8 family serine peptidase, partial [candidate division Zixibacteria bacterium]|nr:S8 family peptidase [candidate division Zixibacteria bacterium]NIS44668.1 S8 family peptidase [candidate division Zixibacteria bacterium]NIU12725.1 S8 family peptidase [candidate division Zixibacteria bacterium]NIV04830.1 S8 family serine peptidase [candidate division Zixibacteria bacterium]NIW43516.1 S8 family serine peptidase [Gammaproteobacteria bacterium]
KTDRILAFADFVSNNPLAEDENGHGTHVAAIIANSQHGLDEEWNGVAPGVDLVGVRVLDETGTGSYVKVIQGIQWVIRHKDIYNIKVMNLSIIANAVSPYWADPLNQAVTRAWAEGIVVVTAAGNAGPGSMTIGVPGNNPYVITVGAFTDNYTPMDFNDDYVVPFSSSGPTLDGFVKPDVVAPGAHITSLMKNNAYLIKQEIAQPVGRNYYQLAGTSQATAVVSGLSALILSKHPELTPDQVKLRIMGTSFVWVDPESTEALYSMWQQGAGRINAYDAVFAEIEGLANEGMDIWADLAGDIHYEGYSYYDETDAVYKLRGDFGTWSGGYGVWSGDYGVWSGGYGVWSGDYGVWSGDYGVWSGDYGVWSGGYGVWSGDYGVWSGGYGVWSGGYGVWSGGYGVWSGTEPWAETDLATYEFVNNYLEAIPPEPGSAAALIGIVESNK